MRREVNKVSKVSLMQGVPAHIESLKAKDKRRHPSRCIFAEGSGKNRICTSPLSTKYMEICNSAKLCAYYEEKYK